METLNINSKEVEIWRQRFADSLEKSKFVSNNANNVPEALFAFNEICAKENLRCANSFHPNLHQYWIKKDINNIFDFPIKLFIHAGVLEEAPSLGVGTIVQVSIPPQPPYFWMGHINFVGKIIKDKQIKMYNEVEAYYYVVRPFIGGVSSEDILVREDCVSILNNTK